MITAEEFMTDEYQIKNYGTILLKPTQAAIEFAKLHVEACKKEIAENAKLKNLDNGLPVIKVIDKESILNAYPLTNIK